MLVSDFFRAQARKLEKEAHVLFMAINTQEIFLFLCALLLEVVLFDCESRLNI